MLTISKSSLCKVAVLVDCDLLINLMSLVRCREHYLEVQNMFWINENTHILILLKTAPFPQVLSPFHRDIDTVLVRLLKKILLIFIFKNFTFSYLRYGKN